MNTQFPGSLSEGVLISCGLISMHLGATLLEFFWLLTEMTSAESLRD